MTAVSRRSWPSYERKLAGMLTTVYADISSGKDKENKQVHTNAETLGLVRFVDEVLMKRDEL